MNKNNLEEDYAIVRQPIFDRKKKVIAYNVEVKNFKDLNKKNRNLFINSKDIDRVLTEGINKVSNGKKVYVHFDSTSIKNEIPLSFSSTNIGVNIEDATILDTELLEKIKKIKLEGFDLIVDGFSLNNSENSIMKLADIFTIDFRIDSIKNKSSIFNKEEQKKIKLLARDVETETDFNTALSKEFDYFQGNFFTRPDIIPAKNIPSFKLNLIKLLEELNKKKLDLSKVEEILKRDVALTYKLLNFMNSASLGMKTTIKSINHALNLLGEDEVKKWLLIMVTSSIGSDKPEELLKTSLIRAKFCELIAEELGLKNKINDCFLTGMFSLMDTFIGRPLPELMLELPLKKEIKMALSGKNNQLLKILDLVKDYEEGRWNLVNQALLKAKILKSRIVEFYNTSIEWSNFLETKN